LSLRYHKYGFGIRDPAKITYSGSEIRKKPIPDPGYWVTKAPDPVSGTATLLYTQIDGGKTDQRVTGGGGGGGGEFKSFIKNLKI
jgi:hypothetical protein